MAYQIPKLPLTVEIETRTVLKQLNASNRVLAELKGHDDLYRLDSDEKIKIGRENYYLNTRLIDLFMNFSMLGLDDDTETIASQ